MFGLRPTAVPLNDIEIFRNVAVSEKFSLVA